MSAYTNRWHFFDKNGNHINPVYDSDVWYADIHFPSISIGLHEVQHLFILEEYQDLNTAEIRYCQPRMNSGSFLRLRWNDTDQVDKNVFLFQIDVSDDVPLMSKVEQLDVICPDGTSDSIMDDRRVLDGLLVSTNALQFNIALFSQEERTYDRILLLEIVDTDETSTIVADFIFRGEVIGEDERFRSMLENFGRKVNIEDFPVFRDVDINEDRVDFIKLNEKRKELLLEGESLYSYMSSYKGLVNAIKFFGYTDLRLKEYWLNIDQTSQQYGTYKHAPIQIEPTLNFPSNKDINLPSKQFKKTSKFGLFYDVTRTTGDLDEYGIPITENAFMFTNEEILVKLFGLKELLKREFLPLNARIIDITGEGIYFEKYRVNAWTDQTIITEVNFDRPVKFSVNSTSGYIEDLRTELKSGCIYDDTTLLKDSLNIPVSSFGQCEIKDVITVSNPEQLPYQTRYPIGAKFTLHNDTFDDISWNELTVTWNSMHDLTWDSVGKGEIFEVEWRVFQRDNQKYSFKKRGRTELLTELTLLLPYTGLYDVSLVLYDTLGQAFSKTIPSMIEVRSKEVEMLAFYRKPTVNLIWNDAHITWDDSNFTWLYPILDQKTTWNDLEIEWETLNYFEYFNRNGIHSSETSFSIIDIDRQNQTITIAGDISKSVDNYIDIKSVHLHRSEDDIPLDHYSEINNAYIEDDGKKIIELIGLHDLIPSDRLILFRHDMRSSGFSIDIETNTITLIGDVSMIYQPDGMITLRKSENPSISQDFYISDIEFNGTNTLLVIDVTDEALGGFSYGSIEIDYDFINVGIISTENDNQNTLVKIESDLVVFQTIIDGIDDYHGIWSQFTGNYNIPVSRIVLDEDRTVLWLDDFNGELFFVTSLFRATVANFDLDYAEKRYGVDRPFQWDSMDKLTWNDFNKLTWDSLDYHGTSHCGFNITQISPNGTIQINNGYVFSFSADPDLTIELAVDQLNASTNSDISMFQYIIRPDNPEEEDRYIQAVAKIPGSTALATIRLSDGVKSDWCGTPYSTFSYPLNNTIDWQKRFRNGQNDPAKWNRLYRKFYEFGESYPPAYLPKKFQSSSNPQNAYRLPFMIAVDGSFSWSDTCISTDAFSVPIMTTVFAVPDNCKVPGKKDFLWKLYDDSTGRLLVEIADKYFIWSFDKSGTYTVVLSLSDSNGNPLNSSRASWITVQ